MWTANPAVVEALSNQRSDVLYDEAKVPGYQLPAVMMPQMTWDRRREQLIDLFGQTIYGRSPGKPQELRFDVLEEDRSAMDGTATMRRVAIRSRQSDREHRFDLLLFIPNQRRPAPGFLFINNRGVQHMDPTRQTRSDFWPAERLIARGFAAAVFDYAQLAPDNHREDRWREGVVRLFDGDSPRRHDSWAAIGAWAWGASRAMDYLQSDPDVRADRIAVIGHSRGGKTALWAGAQDQRFALAISNESGCAGAALARRRFGERIDLIADRFPHWFCPKYATFSGREDELPIDQHQLVALMAPRAVYVADAADDLWADPRGEYLALVAANPAFVAAGDPPMDESAMPDLESPLIIGRRAYHIRPGGHGLTLYDWDRYMDFADRLWK